MPAEASPARVAAGPHEAVVWAKETAVQPFTLYLLTADRMTRLHRETDADRRGPYGRHDAQPLPDHHEDAPSRRRRISIALRRALAGPVGA